MADLFSRMTTRRFWMAPVTLILVLSAGLFLALLGAAVDALLPEEDE